MGGQKDEQSSVETQSQDLGAPANRGKVGIWDGSGLNAGSSFISEDKGRNESPVETLEKAIVLNLFWTEGLTSI